MKQLYPALLAFAFSLFLYQSSWAQLSNNSSTFIYFDTVANEGGVAYVLIGGGPKHTRGFQTISQETSPNKLHKMATAADPDSCDLDSINLSTGRDQSTLDVLNPPDRDPHWYLVSEPGQPNQFTQSYVVDKHNDWASPLYGTQWISNSVQGASSASYGRYVYVRRFYVESWDNSLEMRLRYMAKDTGTVIVNGTTVIDEYIDYTTPSPLLVLNSGYFNPGWNTIESHVYHGSGPHGFDLQVVVVGCEGIFNDSIVSTTRPQALASVTAYPNPTSHTLHVKGTASDEEIQYVISDTWGHPLLRTTSPDIDVRALPVGVYILQIETREGNRAIRFSKH